MYRKYLSVLMVLVVALVAAVPVSASGAPSGMKAGAVFVMTNSEAANQVIQYRRAADGTLSYVGHFDTGGAGSGVGVTVPPDPLGSQNSLLLSPDGRWLFAVNAGSDEVSVFKVRPNGLKLTGKASSGGDYPVSLAYHNGLLYVLNAAGDGSINGFRVSDVGTLAEIPGSYRSLEAATPADGSQPHILESPAQVGFSPDGGYLIVVDKGGVSGTGRFVVFGVDESGRPSESFVETVTADPVPFAFVFDPYGHLVAVDASAGTITAYALASGGHLAALSSVANGQAAVCWIATNGAYIFTDNTGSNTVSAVGFAADGSLTLLDAVAASTGDGTLPLDMGISQDGQFLYTLNVGEGKVGEFRINADGSLTPLGTIGGFDPVSGVQGIAVR